MTRSTVEFPEMITRLPEADIPLEGVRGYLLQGGAQQAVFLEIEPIGALPEHSHAAQFGIVLEGEMSLTVDGVTRRYGPGDSYYIPAGVPHRAEFHSRFRAVDFFDEPERYRAK